METLTTGQIREKIIELNYYLVDALRKEDKQKIETIRIEINSLIKLYLK